MPGIESAQALITPVIAFALAPPAVTNAIANFLLPCNMFA